MEEKTSRMNFLIVFSILLAAAVAGVLAYLVRKVAFAGEPSVTSRWIEDLSLDRYRSMLRMLDGGDIDFLRFEHGFAEHGDETAPADADFPRLSEEPRN